MIRSNKVFFLIVKLNLQKEALYLPLPARQRSAYGNGRLLERSRYSYYISEKDVCDYDPAWTEMVCRITDSFCARIRAEDG